MLKLILKQTNWGVLGAVFGFSIGFFVKIYLIDIVGLDAWGKYVAAQTFSSAVDTFLAIGIPFVILKFIPSLLENNKEKAKRLAAISIKYSLFAGALFFILMYFLSPFFDLYLYTELNNFSLILFIMCAHIPISLLLGVITSLYRSVLKIREIVLYGTLISVSIRAFLTFIIFSYTDDITYFIFIELFTQFLILCILYYLFNKNEFCLFSSSSIKEFTDDRSLILYSRRLYFNTLIAFIAGQALSFIISFSLPAASIGAFNILLTLTGLTTFLLINLNKVFAPAISKLYAAGDIMSLNDLYKKTTFIINIITIPLTLIIVLFADELLVLYTDSLLEYKTYLFFMLIGGMISLASGSCGTFMIMAGLEKENLILQCIKAVCVITLASYFIPLFGFIAVVVLYIVFMLFINVAQLVYLSKRLKISPFSPSLSLLLLITVPFMFLAIRQDYVFTLSHFFLLPIAVYMTYFLLLFYPLKRLLKELL